MKKLILICDTCGDKTVKEVIECGTELDNIRISVSSANGKGDEFSISSKDICPVCKKEAVDIIKKNIMKLKYFKGDK